MPSSSDSRLRRSQPEIGSPAVARARRGWLWAALPVSAGFALFGIVVWLAYKDTARGPPLGEPPLIRAAADPIKLPPEQAEEPAVAESGAIGRLWSDAERADQPERLLPLPEDPLSPPVVAAPGESADSDPSRLGLPPAGDALSADGEAGVAADVPASQPAEGAAMAEAEAALDRLLAEVTALSDGQGAAPSPAESAPPAESSPPAESPQSAAAGAAPAAPTSAAPSPVAPGPEAEDETTAAAEAPDATPPESQEIRQASALSASPEPETAPREPVEEAPATQPAAAPQEPTQVAAIEDRYRVQLAAVRGEADAHRAWDLFLADLGDVLRDVQPFFERAETANGIFYRVQIGPFASQDAAESRCEDLKQRNASCFVIRR